MRQGGLRDRIARAVVPEGQSSAVSGGASGIMGMPSRPSPEAAELINALARSLEELTTRAVPPPLPTSAAASGAREPAEPAEMPQILQPHRMPANGETTPAARWRIGQIVAPVVLALALAGVAGLMFTPPAAVERLAGAAKSPASKATLITSLSASGEREAAAVTWSVAGGTALSVEDIILLDRAESMLMRGDVDGARRELSAAAASGNQHARFALAETYDPNMLAARGLRSPVADAGTARALYIQALDAGDSRAQRRLDGLGR